MPIVPFAPGGATGGSGWAMADKPSVALGRSVVAESRSGANGAIGAEAVMRGAPNGRTLLHLPLGRPRPP